MDGGEEGYLDSILGASKSKRWGQEWLSDKEWEVGRVGDERRERQTRDVRFQEENERKMGGELEARRSARVSVGSEVQVSLYYFLNQKLKVLTRGLKSGS